MIDNSENPQADSWARLLGIREDGVEQVRRRIKQLLQDETDRFIGNGPADPETLCRALSNALQRIS